MIKKSYVRTYINELYCDKCGAKMEATNDQVLTVWPPKYTYICLTCGNTEVTSAIYNMPEYEIIEEEQEQPVKWFKRFSGRK